MMKAVNLRELKNRLGGYVREVRAGEVILVTDRGQVVAELRAPLHDHGAAASTSTSAARALERLASEGKARLGIPSNRAYPVLKPRGRAGLSDALVEADRDDR